MALVAILLVGATACSSGGTTGSTSAPSPTTDLGTTGTTGTPGEPVAPLDERVTRIPIDGLPYHATFADGLLWVAGVDGGVWAIDPATNEIVRTFTIDTPPARHVSLAVGDGRVWFGSDARGDVVGLDAATGEVVETIDVRDVPNWMTLNHGALWISDSRTTGCCGPIPERARCPVRSRARGRR